MATNPFLEAINSGKTVSVTGGGGTGDSSNPFLQAVQSVPTTTPKPQIVTPQVSFFDNAKNFFGGIIKKIQAPQIVPQNIRDYAQQELTRMQITIPQQPKALPSLDIKPREGVSATIKQPKTAKIKEEPLVLSQYRDVIDVYREVAEGKNKNVLEKFAKGVKESFRFKPFIGSIEDVTSMLSKKDDEITEKAEALYPYSAKDSIAYKAGAVLAQIPEFATEFLATGGIFTVAKGATVKALTKVAMPSLVSRAGGLVIGGIAQGTIGGAPRIAAKTVEFSLPKTSYDLVNSSEGKVTLERIEKAGDPFPKALTKAWGTTTVEYVTERMGVVVDKPLDVLKRAIFAKWLAGKGITTPSLITQIQKGIAWNGIIGEVFEEELAELAQAPIEEREYKAPFLTPEGTERLLVETLGIGIFGGISTLSDVLVRQAAKITDRPTISEQDVLDYLKKAPEGTIVTPQQARDNIVGTVLENTIEGKSIIKASFEAEAQGKSIKLGYENGKLNIDFVEPQVTEPVEEVKPKETEGIKDELKPTEAPQEVQDSYSGDIIAMKNQIKKPVEIEGKLYIATEGFGQEITEVIPTSEYKGETTTYQTKEITDEMRTNRTFYEGMKVNYGKTEYVLGKTFDYGKIKEYGDQEVTEEAKKAKIPSEAEAVETKEDKGEAEKIPEAPTKPGKISPNLAEPEEIDDILQTKHGKHIDDSTATELKTSLTELKKPMVYNPNGITGVILKRVSSPPRGIELKTLDERPNLFWGNIKNNTFTDGFLAILNTLLGKEVNTKLLENEKKRTIKQLQSSESKMTFKEAEERADKMFAEKLKEEISYPNLQSIVPKEYSQRPAEIQGFESIGEMGVGVYLSDGKTWAVVNADKLAFMQKYLPDHEMRLSGQFSPVVFVRTGTVDAIMMPIRTESANPFPQEPISQEIEPEEPIEAKEKVGENLGFIPKDLEEPKSPQTQGKVEKLVKQSEITKRLSEKLNVPIRRGKFRAGKAVGIFKPGPKVIRTKRGGIRTIFHEAGHFIDDQFGFSKDLDVTERKALMEEYGAKYKGEPARQRKEAFAEYIRFSLTNQQDKIDRMAPEFDKTFKETINKFPEVKEILDIARADYIRWNEQPATAKVLSHISIGDQGRGSLKDRVTSTVHDLYTSALDDLHPLSEFSAIGKKKLGDIPSTEDPYILARNLRGWIGKADLFLNRGTFGKTFWTTDEKGQTKMVFNGKSYSEIMKPIEKAGKLDEFRVYIISQRIVYDLAPRGIQTGISLKDAEAALEELGRKNPEFEKVAQERREYKDRLLKYAAENGLIGPEGLAKIKELNKYHVPFYRVMEESQVKFLGKTKLAGNIANPIKRIKGSEREIIDPFESDVKDTYAIINAAERNNIGVAMANISQKDFELGRLFEKVDKPLKPVQVGAKEVLEKAFKDNGMEGVLPEDLAEIAVTLFRPTYATGPNMLNVNMGDKSYVFQVDPDLFKAIQGLNIEDVGIIMRMLGMPAKLLRAGATLTPDFSLRNPIRDQFSAFVYSKYGYLPGVDLIRGIFEIFRKGDVYNLWKAGGGQHSMLVSLDRNILQKNFNEILASKGAKTLKFFRNPLNALQIISELTEQATRLGEMRQAVKKGVDPISGAFASREVTLDFARIGAKTRAFNLIIAFFNANVQGTDKMIRSFRFHPFRTLIKVLLGITLPSILLYFANRDDPRWKELPQWQKDLFWIVLTEPGTLGNSSGIWRLPKPFELGIIFGSVPERILEVIDRKDPSLFDNLKRSVANGATPGLLPTILVPIIENITNYSFFLDRPIVGRNLENLTPEEQAGTYTSQFSRLIGQALHYSPAKIDNLINGYTGGVGRYAVSAIDEVLKKTGIVNPPTAPKSVLEDIAVIKAFTIREPIGSNAESVNKLYNIYGNTNSKVNTLKKYVKEGDAEKADLFLKQHPEIQYSDMLNGAISTFSDMNKVVQIIRNSRDLSPEEKRFKIDELGRLQVDIAQRVLSAINEQK